MWVLSSKRLLHIYDEKRLYITDLLFDQNRLPARVYLFISEYGTEIELSIESVKLVKRFRTRQSDIYQALLNDGDTVLIRLDHLKGNHFLYCRLDTYDKLIEQYVHAAPPEPSFETSAAVSAASLTPERLRDKILFIDSDLIPDVYRQLEQWLVHNEVLLSPYYREWLHAHVSHRQRADIIEKEIVRISRLFAGKVITDQYVDLEPGRFQHRSLADDREYLLILAQQLNITVSQIVMITRDSDWSLAVRAQGMQVLAPDKADYDVEKENDGNKGNPVPTSSGSPPILDTGLPPRSQRHKFASKAGKHNKRFPNRSMLHFMYQLIF